MFSIEFNEHKHNTYMLLLFRLMKRVISVIEFCSIKKNITTTAIKDVYLSLSLSKSLCFFVVEKQKKHKNITFFLFMKWKMIMIYTMHVSHKYVDAVEKKFNYFFILLIKNHFHELYVGVWLFHVILLCVSSLLR